MFSLQVLSGLSLQVLNATTFTPTSYQYCKYPVDSYERPDFFFPLLNILKMRGHLIVVQEITIFTGTIVRNEVSGYRGVCLMLRQIC